MSDYQSLLDFYFDRYIDRDASYKLTADSDEDSGIVQNNNEERCPTTTDNQQLLSR